MGRPTSPGKSPNEADPSTKDKRLDIQGLRALAVILVVGYHAFPNRLPGGFVGVDIFFVISGFLITLLLLKELRSGKIQIGRFYARRVRRLFPAAFVAILLTIGAATLVLGPLEILSAVKDMFWVSMYVVNYHFAQLPSGYFATEPSPFLHFWSLAVEEQFYLLWPLILILAARLSRIRQKGIGGVLILIVGGSLLISLLYTTIDPVGAFFSLSTRAWEFAVGGVLAWAVLFQKTRTSPAASLIASCLGVLAIATASLIYSEATPFPGLAALLPTFGALLLIWAGFNSPENPVARALSWRPLAFLGDISYSLYLYHWPVLLLGAGVLGAVTVGGQLALIGVALCLSIASYFVIERRFILPSIVSSRRVIATGLGVAAIVAATALSATSLIPVSGGPAITPLAGLVPRWVPSNVEPALADVPDDMAEVFHSGCFAATVVVCEGGDPNGRHTIVLTGDSHAGQWWPAINAAGLKEHWKIYLVGKNGCPMADVAISRGATPDSWPECDSWQMDALSKVRALNADLIIVANNATGYERDKVSLRGDFAQLWKSGLIRTLTSLESTTPVLLLGQTPTLPADPAACLLENLKSVDSCSSPRHLAIPPRIRQLNEEVSREVDSEYFDPASILCSISCPVMMDNIVMYHNSSHLSATFVTQLSDELATVIERSLGSSSAYLPSTLAVDGARDARTMSSSSTFALVRQSN